MTKKPIDKLVLAEELFLSRPDSAQMVLESIDFPEDFTESDYSDYLLLITKVHKRNLISIKNDTLITKAITYYRTENNLPNLTEAILYAGRVYGERESVAKARGFFLESYDLAQRSGDYNLTGTSAYELGESYESQNEYSRAIHWFDLSAGSFREKKLVYQQANSLRKIADCYVISNKIDSAFILYNNLLDMLPSDRSGLVSDIYKNMAITYLKAQQFNPGIKAIKKSIMFAPNKKLYPVQYLILADLYEYQGRLDSANHYSTISLKYAMELNDISSVHAAYESSSEGSSDDGQLLKTMDSYRLYKTSSDSIYQKQKY